MIKEKIFYLIYRVYNDDIHDNPILYGWTETKSVAKAFLNQRNPKKYLLHKMTEDELISEFSESMPAYNIKLDYVKLSSVRTGEKIIFFTTLDELRETEKKIQATFKEMSSIAKACNDKNSKELMYYFTMFMNIKNHYKDALYDIGFRPPEVDILFDSADNYTINDTIDYSYEDGLYFSDWENSSKTKFPAQTLMEDIFNTIIYSMESVIKVLYDDL